jgi:2-phospho-L-lactate guanylyltransferase
VETVPDPVVLVPVKAFSRAKHRLSGVLGAPEREALARSMAARVLAAAAPLRTWVVCDDPEVARWARQRGADVAWTPGHDLNGAVQAAWARRCEEGARRAVVLHADLPLAESLGPLLVAADDEVVIVPDRHGTGTNALSVPAGRGFTFRFGPESFAAHLEEAARCGLRARPERDAALGWDVDEPGDLLDGEHPADGRVGIGSDATGAP